MRSGIGDDGRQRAIHRPGVLVGAFRRQRIEHIRYRDYARGKWNRFAGQTGGITSAVELFVMAFRDFYAYGKDTVAQHIHLRFAAP